jgi:uncharacterized protein YbjT (DUF2867 family)
MKIILFGATGMVGQGVLRECLKDPGISEVLCILRGPTGMTSPKLREIIHSDFFNYTSIQDQLSGFDACFFPLGVSSAGMKEEEYRHLSFDLTLAAAKALVDKNSAMTFIYVSGTGSDSTEKGRVMWARVKGATENALLKLPFKAVYLFRPGYIQPLDGIKSKTKLYSALYAVVAPLYPFLNTVAPKFVTTTEKVGLAMIRVARNGYINKFLENSDINEVAEN